MARRTYCATERDDADDDDADGDDDDPALDRTDRF